MNTIELNFDGYWTQNHLSSLPKYNGIYIANAIVFDEFKSRIISIRVIYIGASENIKNELSNSLYINRWKKVLTPNEELFFSAAPISNRELTLRLLFALISSNKPVLNIPLDHPNDHSKLLIVCKGVTHTLKELILVGP